MDLQPESGAGRTDSTCPGGVRYKGKVVRVFIADEAQQELDRLSAIVQQEKGKGILQSDHQVLFNSIQQKLALLCMDPGYGIHIAKRKIPKEYIQKYKITNLWKVNLAGAWRILYTNRGSAIEILVIILDILDHRAYEKRFSYRKS